MPAAAGPRAPLPPGAAKSADLEYVRTTSTRTSGAAWVSGRGGIRGYATKGVHRDPYQNRFRRRRRST